MKIRTKLFLLFMVFTLLILSVVSINYVTYSNIESDSNFVNSAGRLRANSYRMAYLSYYTKANPGDNKAKEQLQERVAYFDKLLTSLEQGDKEAGLKELNNEKISPLLASIQDKWGKEFKPIYEQVIAGNTQDIDKITSSVDNYVVEIDKMVSTYSEISSSKVIWAKTLSILSFLLGLIIVILSLIFVRKGIINPINTISKEMKEIALGEGDLTKVLQKRSNDEIGELTDYFNSFISNIRKIVTLISGSADDLTISTEAISSTSGELAKSTEMIAISVQEVSEGSLEQSGMAHNLDNLVREMEDEIKKVILHAQSLLKTSELSRDAADEGKANIDKQVQELQFLVQNVQDTAKTVDELQIYSKNIAGIIEIINNISVQTNLLALNASIEAARAGEAGRGFAVVAEEIRKLAVETASSTEKIVDIVKNITGQTGQVKGKMDTMVLKIKEQSEYMLSLEGELQEIVEKSSETYDSSKEIEYINEEIKNQFQAISADAHKISVVVENNSNNMQSVAAAVEEQTASFEEVAASMATLNDVTKDLKGVVTRFKI